MNFNVYGIILVILIVSLSYCEAAIAYGVFKDPNNPGKCVFSPNFVRSVGIYKYPLKECARIICGKNGKVQVHTCGIQGSHCKLGERLYPNANYPACCMRREICISKPKNMTNRN